MTCKTMNKSCSDRLRPDTPTVSWQTIYGPAVSIQIATRQTDSDRPNKLWINSDCRQIVTRPRDNPWTCYDHVDCDQTTRPWPDRIWTSDRTDRYQVKSIYSFTSCKYFNRLTCFFCNKKILNWIELKRNSDGQITPIDQFSELQTINIVIRRTVGNWTMNMQCTRDQWPDKLCPGWMTLRAPSN